MTDYDGRLELTWTNKHQRLLAHEDGSYEWVVPSDYRVAEVRLLDDVTTFGETSASENTVVTDFVRARSASSPNLRASGSASGLSPLTDRSSR